MTKWNFLAVSLMLGASALVGCNKDETGKTPGQQAGEATQKGVDSVNNAVKSGAAALTGVSADKLENTRDVVASVVNNALSRNNWKDITANFPNDAEKKLNDTKPETKDLDDLADAVNSAWKDKYKNSFKVKDLANTYDASFLKLAAAEASTTAPSAGETSRRATGTIATSHGLPDLTIPFVEESKKWKIQVPDTLDGAKLHDNLKAALTDIGDKSKWPDSEQEAYRFVTHRIMMAVLDKT